MKRIVCLIVIMTLFISCTSKSSDQKNSNSKNSKSEMLEKARLDSIEKARIDSVEQIAWGDIKFGDSKKKVMLTKTFKDAYKENDENGTLQSILKFFPENIIDGLSTIKASFFDDKLYRIDLESHKWDANYFNTRILNITNQFKKMISDKYGEPTNSIGFPRFIDMQSGNEIIAYMWKLGDKYIIINVGEVYSGSEYFVSCNIISEKRSMTVKEYISKQKEEEESKKNNGF